MALASWPARQGAAAELAEDRSGLELGVRPLAEARSFACRLQFGLQYLSV